MDKEQNGHGIAAPADESCQSDEAKNKTVDEALDELPSQGIVYILTRENQPGISKVGYTGVSAKSRAKGYTDGDWVIDTEYSMPLWLARLTEKATHKQLEQYWLNPGITGGTAQEVFLCNPDLAKIAIESALKEQRELALVQMGVPESVVGHICDGYNLAKKAAEIEEIYELEITEIKEGHRLEIAATEEKYQYDILLANRELSCSLDAKKALNAQIKELSAPIKELEEKYEFAVNQVRTELESLIENREQRISELERYFDNLSTSMSKNELILSLRELESFDDRRHTYDDFSELLDKYRAAIRLIHSLKP
jgi:hypothetical protein